jgi:uncharacterized protein (TIGR02145 family)
MDSASAVTKLKEYFLADPSVSSATTGGQGVAVLYKNGMKGGIFLNPKDAPEIKENRSYGSPLTPVKVTKPKSLGSPKTVVVLNPHNWERTYYANQIYQSYNDWLPNVGFFILDGETYNNEQASVDRFTELANHGIVHVYSHGWAWPSETNIQEVYLKTGEQANDATTKKYAADIKNGNIIIANAKVYISTWANVYYISEKFVASHNDFSKDTVLFYGGFCYSFLGSWNQLYKSFAKGAYFGFDWSVETNRNAQWGISLVDSLCDTLRRPPFRAAQWMDGSNPPKSYFSTQFQKTVSIHYAGDPDLALWKTLPLPVLSTTPASAITHTMATCGGNITSDAGTLLSARGVCWSTSHFPTITDPHTSNGPGIGIFTSSLTGLIPNTPYYVRAYAYNEAGIAYGNQQSFTTTGTLTGVPCPGIPTVSYGGQTYNTVVIGTQCWFRENLNIGTLINGATASSNNGIIEKYCLDNAEANCTIYGAFYEWDELMQYDTIAGVQGICPSGWHVPADPEWTILVNYLDGDNEAGGELKEAGLTHWDSPNYGATNGSGFTSLPAGIRSDGGSFLGLGTSAYFWSSTQYSTFEKWDFLMNTVNKSTGQSKTRKTWGESVRCLKN